MIRLLEKKITKITDTNKFFSILFEIQKINFGTIINFAKENNKKFFYWAKPSEEYVFIAFDKILELDKGSTSLSAQINRLKKNFLFDYLPNVKVEIPLIVGGVKFNSNGNGNWDDFADDDWFIPRFVFLRNGNGFYLVVNIKPKEEAKKIVSYFSTIADFAFSSVSGHSLNYNGTEIRYISGIEENQWKEKINLALKLIKKKTVEKIVISRYVLNKINGEVDFRSLLSSLAENYPFCTVFAYNNKNSFFFGATPETLFRVKNNMLETDALAGSISRGKTIYEDEKLGNELLASDKNLREHKKVVEFIITNLEKHARTIVSRDLPKIRKLKNIQHLWTPIKASLSENADLISLLYDLHPTPAVCGSPKEVAYYKINEIENFERGLFTGVVGWFNFNNEADFDVAIRSALIKDNYLYAYAGCGIVEGSDATEEFNETRLKLKPILNLFGENEY